jgi:surface protein
MKNPVVAADGHSYECEAITQWLRLHPTSPLTNVTFRDKRLFPNLALRSVIEEWRDMRKAHKQAVEAAWASKLAESESRAADLASQLEALQTKAAAASAEAIEWASRATESEAKAVQLAARLEALQKAGAASTYPDRDARLRGDDDQPVEETVHEAPQPSAEHSSAALAHVEVASDTSAAESMVPVCPKQVRPAVLTNETLREAVKLWFSDRVEATARYGLIGEWDTSDVTDMSQLFKDQEDFNEDISGWDVSKVATMNSMFKGAYAFNQPLERWAVSKCENMFGMFRNAYAFNQPLEKWNVSNVKVMSCMFACSVVFNQPLEKWDLSNVKEMSNVFRGATAFNQPKTIARFK